MRTLHRRCAGLDVHKKEVVACLRVVNRGKVSYELRRFPTTTRGLVELGDWLEQAGCTHVAMEATGVYWKPVWHILEGRFQQILANAAHIKAVPGRKSDTHDATWISDLLAHGLIRASFVPPQPIQEVRDLTRTRKQLTREIVQHTQRVQAVLEEANVKLSSVITDILGASGRRILKAIVAGETDPMKLAELGGPRLAATKSELTDALHGRVRPHHQFLIGQHLKTIEQLEETITAFDGRIEVALEPFRDAIERLKEVPGLSETSAQILLAEVGTDMRQFPTAGHLLSWAGLIPRLDESAGKRRSTRVRKGAQWLKPVLVQCAWAASRKKNSYFEAQFLRLKARRGPKKAVVAVAASILTTAYHMLARGTCYQDLGADHFARRNPVSTAAKLANRIRNLGFHVEIRPAA
ncbi:MAG TPA: IS110 family transposase [Hyphomicrobiaceae bacterium]